MTETTTDYRQIVIDSAELHSVAGDDWETSLLTGAPEPFGRDEALGIARFLECEADVNWGWNQRHHDIAGEIRRRVALADAPSTQSHEAAWTDGAYQCPSLGICSTDGDEWIAADGEPASGGEFDAASIILIGGPRNGETVA